MRGVCVIPTFTWIILIVVILFIINQERDNKAVVLRRIASRRKGKEDLEMEVLAKKFIEMDCILHMFGNSSMTGVIKEVSDGAVLVETKYSTEVVNLDFVVRIQEYPRKKNGKKRPVVFG